MMWTRIELTLQDDGQWLARGWKDDHTDLEDGAASDAMPHGALDHLLASDSQRRTDPELEDNLRSALDVCRHRLPEGRGRTIFAWLRDQILTVFRHAADSARLDEYNAKLKAEGRYPPSPEAGRAALLRNIGPLGGERD